MNRITILFKVIASPPNYSTLPQTDMKELKLKTQGMTNNHNFAMELISEQHPSELGRDADSDSVSAADEHSEYSDPISTNHSFVMEPISERIPSESGSDADCDSVTAADEHSEYSDPISTNSKGAGKRDIIAKKQEAELLSITKSENQAVFWLRMILILVLLFSAVVVVVVVYTYSSTEEENSFESEFESDAQKLFESIGNNFDLTMGAADAFMFRIVSQARSTNAVWPYVTIPDLPVQAAKLIGQTNSIYVAFYPLIPGDKRKEWENFTKHNDGWVEESLRVQSKNPNFHGPILTNFTKSHVIWRNDGPEAEDNPGPFLPSWMGSPVIPKYPPYNWNGLAYDAFSKGLVYCMDTKSVVVTAVANHADPDDPVAVAQAATTSDWAFPYLDDHVDPREPFSDMYYPVLEAIDDVVIQVTYQTKALGTVAFSFFWRDALQNALPSNSKGIVLVFQNACGDQQFTYQIDGKTPTFLGYGDLHDRRYDDIVLTKALTDLSNMNGLYTGRPMNKDFCPYTIHIYPSSIMEDRHVTMNPVIYTIGVALIFFFTSVLFLAYDWFVNRRQRLLKDRALASGAIVSALFPEQVRSRLYEDNDTDAPSRRESPFKADTHNRANPSSSTLGRPNAHLYEGTTVFFADLVGFTAWSAGRTPVQVFELLESLCEWRISPVPVIACNELDC
jgi:hypothetical protein